MLLLCEQSVLLASIFLNGSLDEREHIMSQLFCVFGSDDLDNIYLASRCLCEILEEANFQSQVGILEVCDSSLSDIVRNIDRSYVHIIRNVAKAYRLVAYRICDARLANDFTADIDDSMTSIFSSWMTLMVEWCRVDMDTGDVLESLGVLIEVVQFLSVVLESFPALASDEMINIIMQLAWKYLNSLIGIEGDVFATYGGHIPHDGDRIETGVFVMHLFELLKICLNISSQQTTAMSLDQEDLNNLMEMLIQYMRLNDEKVEQYLSEGNEFVANDQDETLELSLRHTGCDFVHELFMSNPTVIFEAIVSKVECDLANFYRLLPGNYGDLSNAQLISQGVVVEESVCIPQNHIVALEASLFTLRCMGKKFSKRYMRAQRLRENRSDGGKGWDLDAAAQVLEEEGNRIRGIICGLVNTFFNDKFLVMASSTTSDDDHDEGDGDVRQLSICRGIISSLITACAPVLPPSLVGFLISVMIEFSSPRLAEMECLASRLYHCTTVGILISIAVRQNNLALFGEDSTFERLLESFLDICSCANDMTIHIPLENASSLLNNASLSLRLADSKKSLIHFLTSSSIESLVILAYDMWFTYGSDPFCVEITRESMLSLLSAVKIEGLKNKENLTREDLLTIFCKAYFARLEDIMCTLLEGRENSKNICDNALRVLVESMVSSTASVLSNRAEERAEKETQGLVSLLSIPTLQALTRMLDVSLDSYGQDTDEGYRIDVGDTLRSFNVYFSIKGLELCSVEEDVSNEIITLVLNSTMQILDSGDEYNYPAIAGCLSHLLVHFSRFVNEMEKFISILQHVVRLISESKPKDNIRNVLMMCIVHLFCRDPDLVSNSLSSMCLEGVGNGLGCMIDIWFELHPLLESRYNRHISTLGMMNVLEMYIFQGLGEGFLHRVLQLIVFAVNGIENETEEVRVKLYFTYISFALNSMKCLKCAGL